MEKGKASGGKFCGQMEQKGVTFNHMNTAFTVKHGGGVSRCGAVLLLVL